MQHLIHNPLEILERFKGAPRLNPGDCSLLLCGCMDHRTLRSAWGPQNQLLPCEWAPAAPSAPDVEPMVAHNAVGRMFSAPSIIDTYGGN